MARLKLTREWYAGKDKTEVKDPKSSAVVYLSEYATRGGDTRYSAVGFYGKRQKPSFQDFYYTSREKRQEKIDAFFDSIRTWEEGKIKAREERKKAPVGLEVGDVLSSSWGYEQTNINFYQVVKVSGRMVTVREIARQIEQTGHDQGDCIPALNHFIGEDLKRQARDGSIKINSCQYASKDEPAYEIAGMKVYKPKCYTTTH